MGCMQNSHMISGKEHFRLIWPRSGKVPGPPGHNAEILTDPEFLFILPRSLSVLSDHDHLSELGPLHHCGIC